MRQRFTNCPDSASFSRAIQAAKHNQAILAHTPRPVASSEPSFRFRSLADHEPKYCSLSSEEPSSEEPPVHMGLRSCSTTASEHVHKTSHTRALAYLKNMKNKSNKS